METGRKQNENRTIKWKQDGNDYYKLRIAEFFAGNTIVVAVLTFVFAWIGRT